MSNEFEKKQIVILRDRTGNQMDPRMNYDLITLIRNNHFWWTFNITEKRKIYNYLKINQNVKVPCVSNPYYKLSDLRSDLDYELTFEPEPFLITDDCVNISADKLIEFTRSGNSKIERTCELYLNKITYDLMKPFIEFITPKDAKYKYHICISPGRNVLPEFPGKNPDNCEEI